MAAVTVVAMVEETEVETAEAMDTEVNPDLQGEAVAPRRQRDRRKRQTRSILHFPPSGFVTSEA